MVHTVESVDVYKTIEVQQSLYIHVMAAKSSAPIS